jgi:tetratricopeptide (TPR) repeat protein
MLSRVSCLCLLALTGCATTYDARWGEQPAKEAPVVDGAALAEGDAAWELRGEKEKLIEALTRWEAAWAQAPDVELAIKLARGHHLLGDGYYVLENDAQHRDVEYQQGLTWATRALKLAAPEFAAAMAHGKKHVDAIALAPRQSVPAMYWYATNLGKWAASKGFATRLRYREDVRATMERVKSLDENYFYGGPWRYFGTFEAVTSNLAGGSLEKSEQNYKKAVEVAPNYLLNRVLWADFLCTRQQDRATFKKILDEVIAADPKIDPAIEPENRIEQAKARKLLSEIAEKF